MPARGGGSGPMLVSLEVRLITVEGVTLKLFSPTGINELRRAFNSAWHVPCTDTAHIFLLTVFPGAPFHTLKLL